MIRKTMAGLGFLILSFSSQVCAQTPARNMKKEAMIWEQLKVIAPGSVEDFKAATTALDTDKYDEAVRLYQGVYKKAPNFDPVMRRLGIALVLQGKTEEGLALMQKAVEADRNSDNLSALAQYLAYPSDNKQGTPEQKAVALKLMKEAVALPRVDDDGYDQLILAQLALDNQDLPTFRSATNQLSASHPELMPTHYFKAILAANEEDWLTAEREIKR